MRSRIPLLILLMFLVGAENVFSAMTSTNYQIQWDTMSSGGSDSASSSSYQLRDTIGETTIDRSTSTNYDLRAGYRAGVDDQPFSFSLLLQNRNTQVAATTLSGTTATVNTTSGYSVGNYVLLVENEGASQVTSFGKITSISGSNVTVDSWRTLGTQGTLDGNSDYLYLMTTGVSPGFGTLSSSSVATYAFGWELTNMSSNGHTVSIFDSGDFRTSYSEIADVADGSVTAGSDEYGARSSDTTLAGSTFDTQDTAMTTTPQPVGTESSDVYLNRQFVLLKVAISSSATSGTYSTLTTIIATGSF